ncbi:MAG: OsmC family protein [Catenulispora sp.]|nr:OsmC family protein [Catenulispora sp.]
MTPREPITHPSPTPAPGSEPLARLTSDHRDWRAVTVEHLDGERYAVGVRGHLLLVDQPLADGGSDTAPTPTELLAAALASCVAFYAGRFLDRHGFSRRGLRVVTSFTMAEDRPARIAALAVTVTAPSLPEERRSAFLAVIRHCTVHNTLHQEPQVDIDVR